MKHNLFTVFVLFLSMILLISCSMPTAQPVEPLDLSPPTASATTFPTETIQWFPPTSTAIPFATRTVLPTINQRPSIGTLLLMDDFSSPGSWPTLQSETGNIAFGNGQLNLAIASPNGYLSSIKNEMFLRNFYLEITAAPSLCREMDTYGIILRAADSQNFYRYAITCSGMTRLEWVRNEREYLLHDWQASGQIPIGAPAVLRLGVWAYGDEMRFFIGDHLQFTAAELTLLDGKFGVFARSESTTALTVSFSELSLYGLGNVDPTITPTALPVSATP